jgi:hypothetical protein
VTGAFGPRGLALILRENRMERPDDHPDPDR